MRKIALILAAIIFTLYSSDANAQSFQPTLTINTSGGAEISSGEVYTGLKLMILTSALVFIPNQVSNM